MILFQLYRLLLSYKSSQNLVAQNNHSTLLTDSVGEEFRQGTAQNSCLCFTITGASRGTQMAEAGSAGGSFRHMSGTWAQIGPSALAPTNGLST